MAMQQTYPSIVNEYAVATMAVIYTRDRILFFFTILHIVVPSTNRYAR
jgi:hypothetical protein